MAIKMEFIAHKELEREQTLLEHLENTARLCKEYSIPILKDIAWWCGYYHDIGKYSEDFQKKIRGRNLTVSHADCGAYEIDKILGKIPFKYMLEYCIAGHHTGLQDGGTDADNEQDSTLKGMLNGKHSDYSSYKNEIAQLEINFNELMQYFLKYCKSNEDFIEFFAFCVRYIYSCLTDADFIDTEKFFNDNSIRGEKADFASALNSLNIMLNSFNEDTDIRKSRGELQRQAFKNFDYKSNIHILNMPTGSGKTLCSIKLALEAAIKLNRKRIIYVIPYTSVIEQTAEQFKNIFGKNIPILEHHSNFDFDTSENITTAEKLKKSSENWDYPMIITTNIQFFQSIYDYKSSKLRKLHNMSDSIIVFDEIHMLPYKYLKPCFRAIGYITEHLNSNAILLSATMPDYQSLFDKYIFNNKINYLIRDFSSFKYFDKCEYKYLGECSDEKIVAISDEYENSLIVVNSRKKAIELYKKIEGKKYHLSTYMTPKHRTRVISDIKKDLSNNIKITVVATSLIEVGVDLDFHVVFRELSGLDHILQTGGRCNREGKRKKGYVFVFDFEDAPIYKGELSVGANVSKSLFKEYSNIMDSECIVEYYNRLMSLYKEDIDNNTIAMFNGIVKSFDTVPFRSYSKSFKLIENESFSVVIPDDENKELIEKLKYGNLSVKRALQKYSASLKSYELQKLIENGVIDDYGSGLPVLINSDYYDLDTGLLLEINKVYMC